MQEADNYKRSKNWLKAFELYKRAVDTENEKMCAMMHVQRLCREGKAEEDAVFLESQGWYDEAGDIRDHIERELLAEGAIKEKRDLPCFRQPPYMRC